jgi:hypothetical protein
VRGEAHLRVPGRVDPSHFQELLRRAGFLQET